MFCLRCALGDRLQAVHRQVPKQKYLGRQDGEEGSRKKGRLGPLLGNSIFSISKSSSPLPSVAAGIPVEEWNEEVPGLCRWPLWRSVKLKKELLPLIRFLDQSAGGTGGEG